MPALNTYTAGDLIFFESLFVVKATQVPIDPTKVIFAYSIAGGNTVQYQYNYQGAPIIRTGTGAYNIELDSTGWATTITGQVSVTYEWISEPENTGQAIRTRVILVNPNPLTVTFH